EMRGFLRRARAHEADHRQRALLRTGGERPRHRRAADKSDELAPPHHSMTSSARASNVSGTSMPSACAVLVLITSSNLVGAWTGRSAGLAPLSSRSTYEAACQNRSTCSTPYDIRPPSWTANR